MASETQQRICACGRACSSGLRSCTNCSWAGCDDDDGVVAVSPTPNPAVAKQQPPKRMMSLSCFRTCTQCNTNYRGAACPECKRTCPPAPTAVKAQAPAPVKTHVKAQVQAPASSLTKKNHMLSTCEECKTPIRDGRFCVACRKDYSSSLQNVCADCKQTRIPSDWKFCTPCRKQYKSSLQKVCADCNTTRIPSDWTYCMACKDNFKTSRPCRTCSNTTTRGYYCDACVSSYNKKK